MSKSIKVKIASENDNKNSKNKSKVKNWLNDNKIYFETIMTISLTIMGIIISIISISIEKQEIDIQEKQIIINEQLNMPTFNVTTSILPNSDKIDDKGSVYYEEEIVVFNNGGILTNGYLSADTLIEIVINDSDYKNEIVLTIEDSNSFKYSYSHYDATSNCFRIIKYENSDYSTFYRFQSLRN